MRIYFDMDGTIADLYGTENWLDRLLKEDASPYIEAKPMIKEADLTALIEKGYELAIVSWCCKNGSDDYNKAVRKAKRAWLKKHFPTIKFSEIHIVKYGTPKSKVVKQKDSILFDDELPNRAEWKGVAFLPKIIKWLE